MVNKYLDVFLCASCLDAVIMLMDLTLFYRLTELLPFVYVNRHWGIVSKCLTYSKAASDPFVYSLLRQQYKKVLITVANRLLKRDLNPSSGHSSSMDTENDYSLQRIS